MSDDLDILSSSENPPVPSLPAFDASRYLPHVEDLDLSESQKIEFLQTLFYIMAAFARAGFNVDSVVPAFQKALESPQEDAVEVVIPTHEFNAVSPDETQKAD